ncbi:MAG: hypothetical protein IIW41_03905, partial [Selenomonadaceae bacterium]|nr:hypothetical protein [Selenomonadaceae bacterium]
MAEERGMDKVWQNNFLKKIARHLCNWRMIIPLVLVLLGVGMYFLPQTRLHRAASNQLYDVSIEGIRGTIYDSNMTPLATSTTAWILCANPREIKRKFDSSK